MENLKKHIFIYLTTVVAMVMVAILDINRFYKKTFILKTKIYLFKVKELFDRVYNYLCPAESFLTKMLQIAL